MTDVTDTFKDDFAAGPGTRGAVEVGGSAWGKIQFPGDQDWFAVDLEEGTVYLIDLKGSDTWHATLVDPYLRGVHDADGNLIAGTTNNNGGPGRNSYVEFTAEDSRHLLCGGRRFGRSGKAPTSYRWWMSRTVSGTISRPIPVRAARWRWAAR